MTLPHTLAVVAGQATSAAGPAILGLVIGFVGAAASIVSIWAPRQSNERPVLDQKVPTVRFWRPSNYNLALGQLQVLVKRWQSGQFDSQNRRGFVTEYDLVRWIIQLALTCAANIVPQSLGKASLFRIGDMKFDGDGRLVNVRVYSFELEGIFSVEQMIDNMNPRHMRNLSISTEQDNHNYPAALQCIREKGPTLQSLHERASMFDQPEHKLGLTHILGIPLRQDFSEAAPDQPVSITVDLRFGRIVSHMVDKYDLHHRALLRRARRLTDELAKVDALHRPEFLPPPAPDRGKR